MLCIYARRSISDCLKRRGEAHVWNERESGLAVCVRGHGRGAAAPCADPHELLHGFVVAML